MLLIKRWPTSSVLSGNFKSLYSLCREKKIMMSSNIEASSDVNLKHIPEDERKKQLIELEMRYEKEIGNYYIPNNISADHWKNLLQMKTPLERKQYYRYLKSIEINGEKDKRRNSRKELRRKAMIEEKINRNPHHIQYGLWKNSIFIKLRNLSYNHNLCHAVMFGQKLVIDLGYENMMDTYEMKQCIKQIKIYHGFNKIQKEPFHLNLCNANMDGEFIRKLRLHLPFLQKPHPLINVTEKSYLDLFPKDRLVYLTPHCNEDLTTYNHDDIYIIGGIVDKSRQDPVSLAKAKKESLRMARLPLKKYLTWGLNPRTTLTIDQVMKIMFTMKETMNWSEAFTHVPRRKLNNAFLDSKEGFSFSRVGHSVWDDITRVHPNIYVHHAITLSTLFRLQKGINNQLEHL